MSDINPQGFAILHADESLIIVNKTHRLLSVPGRGIEKQDCLISRVKQQFPDALIVHRLDFDTSGLLVLARGKEMHRALSILFQERKVAKTYTAIIEGKLQASKGIVNLPLLVDWENRPKHQVDFANGKPSITHYERISYDEMLDATRVCLTPETGRSHQLRVHMQAISHPILGDPLYAPEKVQAKANRLLLHATTLQFTHPKTDELLSLNCPAPF